jgi:hypothetical protein
VATESAVCVSCCRERAGQRSFAPLAGLPAEPGNALCVICNFVWRGLNVVTSQRPPLVVPQLSILSTPTPAGDGCWPGLTLAL